MKTVWLAYRHDTIDNHSYVVAIATTEAKARVLAAADEAANPLYEEEEYVFAKMPIDTL